ncbi:ABC transporter substrate-binding protein, partial [Roseibium denhamense]
NLSDLAEGQGGTTSLQLQGGKTTISLTDGTSSLTADSIISDHTAISTTAELQYYSDSTSSTARIGTTSVTAGATVQDLVDSLNALDGVRAEFDNDSGDLTIYSDEDFFIGNQSGTAELADSTISAANFSSTTQILSDTASFAVGDTL